MFIPKIYKLKHRLLGILLDKHNASKNRVISLQERAIPVTDIAKMLNILFEELKYVTPDLIQEKIILFTRIMDENCLCSGEQIGTYYYNKRFLKEGRKYRIDLIKNYLSITVSTIAIIGFITATTTSLISLLNNQKQIKELHKEVDSLKSQKNIGLPSKLYHDSLAVKK